MTGELIPFPAKRRGDSASIETERYVCAHCGKSGFWSVGKFEPNPNICCAVCGLSGWIATGEKM